jgi:uncharacterized membrane protein
MQLLRRATRLLLALAILSSLATSAAPVGVVFDGAVFREIVAIEGKIVPLPPGEWRVTGRSLSDRKLVSLSLLRLHGATADAAVLIQVNRSDASVEWGDPPECGRTDLYYARIRYADDHDISCAYAAHVDAAPAVISGPGAAPGTGATIDPAWQATMQQAAQAGWTVPTAWVVAAFCLGDRHDALAVRYFFAPDRATEAHLSAAHLSAEGARALADWTRTEWDDVARGFRNRRDEAAPTALADFRAGDAPASAVLPDEAPPGQDGSSSLGHIGMKTLTFRIIGTSIDFSTNLLFVGDAALAATMSAVGTVVGPVVFFLHELAWSYADAPIRHTLTLPGIGTEGPDPSAVRASAS